MSDSKKLFENSTKCSKDNYIEFLEFHNRKFSIYYYLYTAFWCMMFLFCILVAFNANARLQGVFVTILLVSFLIYRIVKPKMIVHNELNSDKIDDDNVNTFSFYDKEFSVTNNKGKFVYKYFIVRKVYETKDFFYLYVSKENAFLVSKNTFSLGTKEEFSKFMKSKRKFKYKVSN